MADRNQYQLRLIQIILVLKFKTAVFFVVKYFKNYDLNFLASNIENSGSGYDFTTAFQNTLVTEVPSLDSSEDEGDKKASIWCMAVRENLIIAGD